MIMIILDDDDTECDEYTPIFEYLNIFDPNIYSDIRSCQLFGYEYIWIFVRSKILIRIYSDIHSYQFSGHKHMFLFNFSGYYTLFMDFVDNNDPQCYLGCKSTEM